MTTLVLTVIGDDRSGLVSALSGAIADHDGSWERSQLARLAGKFADGFMGRAKDMVSGAVDWAKSAAPKAAPVETAPGISVGEASMADFNAASNASQRAAINTAANGSNTAISTPERATSAGTFGWWRSGASGAGLGASGW